MKETGPQELSPVYRYIMYRDILNSEPTITVHNVRKLLELEAKTLEAHPDLAGDFPIALVLDQWDKGSRFLAFQFFTAKTGESQALAIKQNISFRQPELDGKALTKFFSRCADTLLNAPLFPGRPDRYGKFTDAIAARETDDQMRVLFLEALAYNQARFGENPDAARAEEYKSAYDSIHTRCFPIAHTY